jgi:hypothetical protein
VQVEFGAVGPRHDEHLVDHGTPPFPEERASEATARGPREPPPARIGQGEVPDVAAQRQHGDGSGARGGQHPDGPHLQPAQRAMP